MESCCFLLYIIAYLIDWPSCIARGLKLSQTEICLHHRTKLYDFGLKQELFFTFFLHQDYEQVHQAFWTIQAKENDLYMVTINKTESKDPETGAKIYRIIQPNKALSTAAKCAAKQCDE